MAVTVDKLRRTMIPVYSGGLDLAQIQQLNKRAESELFNNLKSLSPQRVTLELSSKPIEQPLYRLKEKTQDEILHELHHNLGRRSLLQF
jgi:ribosome maturation factor RimP